MSLKEVVFAMHLPLIMWHIFKLVPDHTPPSAIGQLQLAPPTHSHHWSNQIF